MIDLSHLRADFPVLHQQVHGRPLVYFDNAATSQKPRQVLDVLRHYYEADNATVHRGLHELSMRATDAFEAARARTARFLGAARPEEIIFTRGTTEAVNLVAQVWAAQFLKPGDVILTTGMEHHSNLVPWQLAAQRSGATLRHIPVLDDDGVKAGEAARPPVAVEAAVAVVVGVDACGVPARTVSRGSRPSIAGAVREASHRYGTRRIGRRAGERKNMEELSALRHPARAQPS